MRRIHLDTDIGGDTDDLCALAMLLGWPAVELVGVTTCSDSGGLRAGLARHALRLARHEDVPVAAGAGGSLGGYRVPPGFSDLDRYWPESVAPEPSPAGAALDLLARSVEMGATVVGVGPWTNLTLLEPRGQGYSHQPNRWFWEVMLDRSERGYRPGSRTWTITCSRTRSPRGSCGSGATRWSCSLPCPWRRACTRRTCPGCGRAARSPGSSLAKASCTAPTRT